MPKFRKKPVIVDAEQFYHGLDVFPRGVCTCMSDEIGAAPHVHTAHGNQAVRLASGDWVLPEPDGEHFYPVTAEIFAATFEPVEEPT